VSLIQNISPVFFSSFPIRDKFKNQERSFLRPVNGTGRWQCGHPPFPPFFFTEAGEGSTSTSRELPFLSFFPLKHFGLEYSQISPFFPRCVRGTNAETVRIFFSPPPETWSFVSSIRYVSFFPFPLVGELTEDLSVSPPSLPIEVENQPMSATPLPPLTL